MRNDLPPNLPSKIGELETLTIVDWKTQLDVDGCAILSGVFTSDDMNNARSQLARALAQLEENSTSIRARQGRVYAARNLLDVYPQACHIWRTSRLLEVLGTVLGPNAGLVRGLYFDKPPEQSWSLPWHRDLTIAVKDNRLDSTLFRNPTTKAGVPHVEAPRSVLDRMLTLRIHLDAADQENGALQVMPGSHCDDGELEDPTRKIRMLCAATGDVLLMRPRLAHCSGVSVPGTQRQRRVIHLEFAADEQLPAGFRWHRFEPIG